jgi:uncharacterized membrane protein
VTEVVGRHEWDAVNENWLANRQIGWCSREGLENAGRVSFQPQGPNQTLVTVNNSYNPPGGPPGALDPNASNYIFHSGSAAARSETTDVQNETMSS